MVIGHKKILDFLRKSAEKNRVSHGYLFFGPEKIGKKKVAIEFAKTLQCLGKEKPCGLCKNCRDIEIGSHPDLIVVDKYDEVQENEYISGQISISKIRKLRKALSLSSYLGNYKIAVIDDSHNLNISAANALLKTLEEPKGKAVIILVSAFPHLLPLTIKSRLQQIKFSLVSNIILEKQLEKSGLQKEDNSEVLKITQGRPGVLVDILNDLRKKDSYKSFMRSLLDLASRDINKRFEYVKKISENKDDSIRFLEGLTMFFRDVFLIKTGANSLVVNLFMKNDLIILSERYQRSSLQKIIKLINRLSEMISHSNVNPRLCLEVLMLEI